VEEKILPLTRASQFLNSITSYTGVVDCFVHPDVTLYYTLTRKASHASEDTAADKPSERVLYITIFDHKERANTRIYMHNEKGDHFYSTESSEPVIDPKLGLLQIKLWDEIDTFCDLIAGDKVILSKLREHYQSILDELHFTLINSRQDETYRIENTWTMALADTLKAKRKKGLPGKVIDTNISSCRDLLYFQQGRFARIRRSLTATRGQWVETYMRSCTQEIVSEEEAAEAAQERASGKRRATTDLEESHLPLESIQQSESGAVGTGVIKHLHDMEVLLAKEAEFWEEQLSSHMQKFMTSHDVLKKERLRIHIEWKANCRQRFDGDNQAMVARLEAAKLATNGSDELLRNAHNNIKRTWQSVLEQIIENPQPPSSSTNLSHLETLQTSFQQSAQAIEAITGSSPLNAPSLEQLQRQSDKLATALEQVIFCMDHPAVRLTRLTEFKLSRSKWVDLGLFTEPVEVYMRALRAMNAIFIVIPVHSNNADYYARLAELIDSLPSVTSIHIPRSKHWPEDANGTHGRLGPLPTTK
jgi:hypothetical protein